MKSYRFISVIAALLFSFASLSAQAAFSLKGTVTDEEGMPLYGCIVYISETKGTVTDSLGHYSLSIPNDKTVEIHYLCLGYEDVILTFSPESTFPLNPDVVLKAVTLLDDVVIMDPAPPTPRSGVKLPTLVTTPETVSSAQVPYERIVSFPSMRHLYYDRKTPNIYGERSNISLFFSEWEGWSELIKKGAAPSEYNSIFQKHFLEESPQRESDAKYLSLPIRVKVIKYNCSIHPDSFKVSDESDSGHDDVEIAIEPSYPYNLMKNRMAESISYFTPVIESDKKVLYLSPEAQEILSAFIDEPTKTLDEKDFTYSVRKKEITDDDWKEVRKRRDMIRKYVPTIAAHWGDGWYFTSYPLIRTIIVGEDGYYIEWSNANYSGQEYFVPWDGAPVDLGWWIQ